MAVEKREVCSPTCFKKSCVHERPPQSETCRTAVEKKRLQPAEKSTAFMSNPRKPWLASVPERLQLDDFLTRLAHGQLQACAFDARR